MNWKTLPLGQLNIELSSHCNAACPLCPRYYNNTRLVQPGLKLKSISLEEFKRYFPEEIIRNLNRITYCGTMGDPIMAKDCYEIFQYVQDLNPLCIQRVHTNGGMRDSLFWDKMGKLFSTSNMELVFSIDGLETTNHIYRRNVDWTKLMQNVVSFLNAGGRAYWEWLIFGHNEGQIEEGSALAKTLGFLDFNPKRAFGFDNASLKSISPIPAYDKQGDLEYKIYPPTQAKYQNANDLSKFKDVDYESRNLTEFNNAKELKFFPKIVNNVLNFKDSDVSDLGEYGTELDKKTISCRSHHIYKDRQWSEIYVNSSGLLLPCCFVGTRYDASINYFLDNQLKAKINVNKDDLDLNIHTIKEILDSGILDKIFTDSWELSSISKGKLSMCSETCGSNNPMDNLYV